ncbi:hypothetical protein, partial [Escherichia coli]|uniref:hypothetical protein n=1 Tax=Escherichia coli TaxID=562 RepID=UPI001A7E0449
RKSQQAERPVFATTSAFNVLRRFSGIKKTRIKRALSNVHVCYSPRGAALRSVAELKQFMAKCTRFFSKTA